MAKPRFTPDPPPVGATDAEVIAWEKRQLDRIEDWWPKDLEDRLAALELRWPYKSGTWPIVDGSSISFQAEAAQVFQLTLAIIEDTLSSSDDIWLSTAGADSLSEDRNSTDFNAIQYIADSPNGTLAWYAGTGTSPGTRGISYTQDNFATVVSVDPPSPQFDDNQGLAIAWDPINDRWIIAGVHGSGQGTVVMAANEDFTSWNVLFENSSDSFRAGRGIATDGQGNWILTGTGSFIFGGSWIAVSNNDFSSLGAYSVNNRHRGVDSAYYYDGAWYTLGTRRRLVRSTDTLPSSESSWTIEIGTSVNEETFKHLVKGGSTIVAYWKSGNFAQLVYSTDNGETWLACNTPTGGGQIQLTQLRPLSYSEEFGWVCADKSGVLISSDGITWSAISYLPDMVGGSLAIQFTKRL